MLVGLFPCFSAGVFSLAKKAATFLPQLNLNLRDLYQNYGKGTTLKNLPLSYVSALEP